MKNDTLVTEEGWVSWSEGEVFVRVIGIEAWEGGDGAIFSAQVAHLTGSRIGLVAWWCLTASGWIKMSACSGAVSIGGNRTFVNVVDCGSS